MPESPLHILIAHLIQGLESYPHPLNTANNAIQ